MKVIKVLLQIILILAVLGASVYSVLFGLEGNSSATDIDMDKSFFAYPEGIVGSELGVKLANVYSGKAYVGHLDTYDLEAGTYDPPEQTGTLEPNSKEMAYAIYRIACLADTKIAARSWLGTGWGMATLVGKNAYGSMNTYSSGASVAYTTAAEREKVENLYPGGSYSVSDTYTIVTECSDAKLKPVLAGVLNAGRKSQVGIDGAILEWKCSSDAQITKTGGTAVYMPSQIKTYSAQEYKDLYGDSDRSYTYADLSGEWFDGYGEDSPEKGGHVINPTTIKPRILSKEQYEALTEKGLTLKEDMYNPIDTDLNAYLTKCNADGEDDENGEYYRWDYIIKLTDEASGKTYYRVNISLDCENEETTQYSARSLAKTVGGVATIAYTAYSATFEVWENGVFKMYSSNEKWSLMGAGALGNLGLNAESDANSIEYYSYDEDFIYALMKERYITEKDNVLFPESVTSKFPA